ncbi:MAG: SPASM domain-containing protein, partial [Candidatus Hermodarchaeota archaeon]
TPFGNFQEEQMVSYKEFYSIGLLIAAQGAKYAFQNMPLVGAHCMGYHSQIMPNFKWNGCTAGISTLGITSNGNIVGCLSIGNDRFIEGNIRDQSLKSIWYNKDKFTYNRCFSKSDLGSFCRTCKFAISCRGGCNSVSYSVTKQFHNNPYCYYRIEKDVLK